MKHLLLSLIFLGITVAKADLELEYFDSSEMSGVTTFAPNVGKEIVRRWTWTRKGTVILMRIVTERSEPRNSKRIEQILYQGESKIFLSIVSEDNHTEIYYPTPQIQVARSDDDRDGQIDTISLTDSAHRLVELFSVDDEGLIVPQSDELFEERKQILDSLHKLMKDSGD